MIGRYQTEGMTRIWSDETRFARWTEIELAASEAWHRRGEISREDMEILRTAAPPSPARVREIERETNHDVVAFVRALGESVGASAVRHLHRGLTSSDVVDTALAMTLKDAVALVLDAVAKLRKTVAKRAREHRLTLCAGRTHGVHAEPITYGVRLAGWVAELDRNRARLEAASEQISFGKLSGAVGSFTQTPPELEREVLSALGLQAEPVATQVVPRDRHAFVMTTLALLGGGLERFATDIRALQRTEVREAEEPFTEGQTGSSAMPHKRNPITSERLCGMARLLRGYALAALEDVALWHERDISHSSVERIAFPDAFHLAHYMLQQMDKLVSGMRIYPEAMRDNLERTGGLLFSQNVLGLLLERGLDRQVAYKLVQKNAMRVWEGQAEDFESALTGDPQVLKALGGDAAAAHEALAPAFATEHYTRYVDDIFERAGLDGSSNS
jgi:adenylosuccinate lyase